MEILLLIVIISILSFKLYSANLKLKNLELERDNIEAYNYSLIEIKQKLELIVFNLANDISKISLLKKENIELFESLSDKIVSLKNIYDIKDKIIYYDKLEKCLYKLIRNYDPIEDKKFIENTFKEIEEKYRL